MRPGWSAVSPPRSSPSPPPGDVVLTVGGFPEPPGWFSSPFIPEQRDPCLVRAVGAHPVGGTADPRETAALTGLRAPYVLRLRPPIPTAHAGRDQSMRTWRYWLVAVLLAVASITMGTTMG